MVATAQQTPPISCEPIDSKPIDSKLGIATNASLDYYGHIRKEILPYLPDHAPRVLEVGCGKGATLSWLKHNNRANWVGGIEIVPDAAEHARNVCDWLQVGNLEQLDIDLEPESLDMILALDVLEHLVDPWAAMERLMGLLKPGGTFIAIIPNVGNRDVVKNLVFRRLFEYSPAGGILDITHLRFFTRKSAVSLLSKAGLHVQDVSVTGLKKWRSKDLINRLFFKKLTDWYAIQFVIHAVKPT